MENRIKCLFALLFIGSLALGCKKDDDDDNGNDALKMEYYFKGNVNGVPVSWYVDNVNYKMSMAPYNSNNVSVNNNYIRYGTSIWTNAASQTPFICVEFSGFEGNVNDKLSPVGFISYFHTGSYPYSTAANQDTAIGVNIAYETNANYLDIHESAQTAQPVTSSFNVDSLDIVQETNKTTKAYLKISFEATLRNPDSVGNDIVITDGVLRVLIDNFLEG